MESKILEEIKEYMEKYHISYAEVAKKSGMSRQMIWFYLNGRKDRKKSHDIQIGSLEKICHALGFRVQIQLIPDE